MWLPNVVGDECQSARGCVNNPGLWLSRWVKWCLTRVWGEKWQGLTLGGQSYSSYCVNQKKKKKERKIRLKAGRPVGEQWQQQSKLMMAWPEECRWMRRGRFWILWRWHFHGLHLCSAFLSQVTIYTCLPYWEPLTSQERLLLNQNHFQLKVTSCQVLNKTLLLKIPINT